MKHFLQIVFIGSVLFVLLGLYNQQERVAGPDVPVDDLEQLIHVDGILAYHHQNSGKISTAIKHNSNSHELEDIRKPSETIYSSHIRSEYKISLEIYAEILQTILHMKGLFPHILSGKEILS